MRIWVIARSTFLEARRNRVTWSILLFSIILVLASFVFQEVTVSSFDRIVRDVGLATIHAFGALLAVFLGVSVVTREIDRRTAYYVLSKPLSRWEYLVGKVLGVWVTLIVSLGAMLVAFLLEMVLCGAPIRAVLFQAFWLMLLELLVLTSFSVLASGFTSSAMSAFMSISLFVIGHVSSDLQFFTRKSPSPLIKSLGRGLYFLLPDLEKLNLKDAASLLQEVPASRVLGGTAYAGVWVVAFLCLAVALFGRRDLK